MQLRCQDNREQFGAAAASDAILVWGVAVHQAKYDGVRPLGSQPGNYSNKWPSLYLLTAASMAFVNVAGLSYPAARTTVGTLCRNR